MMGATGQIDLLTLLALPANAWTLVPAITAALLAAPILTAAGMPCASGPPRRSGSRPVSFISYS